MERGAERALENADPWASMVIARDRRESDLAEFRDGERR
jgi:hypothetical protein